MQHMCQSKQWDPIYIVLYNSSNSLELEQIVRRKPRHCAVYVTNMDIWREMVG